ncbi:SPOR domain-containing protein [Scopulibacillus cellulosilyticus]|uniref:SPOR domain-containing protein n=1 Tax=Scopulibacillus cellulosilyticus TaxID=2665665 RepID=A0ABW2PUC9_9BACL
MNILDINAGQGDSEKEIYRVICGSFADRKNAEARDLLLKSYKVSSFITSTKINGKTYYRVQTGAFTNKENAEQQVKMLEGYGLDAFIITAQPENVDKPSGKQPKEELTIRGTHVLLPEHLNAFVRSVNEKAPLLGRYYIEFGYDYGIRGDVAFAQAILETNYFRFTGDVSPDQNNFAGLGATGGGAKGASFATPKEGVLAHLQHLYAYAALDAPPDKYPIYDPRFDMVKRGSAVTWTELNGKWAVPGDQYGQHIIDIYIRMLTYTENLLEQQQKLIKQTINEIKN